MKLKDKKLLHAKTKKDLETDLDKSIQSLDKLKLDQTTNKLKDTSQLKKLRYKIAFIKTLISQK